jgi:hypothetical protein
MGTASIYLVVVGTVVSLIGWSLFLRMAIELNKVLPPDKRIPLIEFRNHISRIRRLHEDSFPESGLSTTWLILTVAAGLVWAAAIITELIRISKVAHY